EKGLLPRVDRNDPDLDWGNHRAIIETIHLIAHRKGLGDLLADGVRAAAQKMGAGVQEFAMHTKGLEIPYYDPRAFACMAVNYATANRGACHLESLSYFLSYGVPLFDLGYEATRDPQGDEGKAKLCYDLQNYMAVYNPLGICKFLFAGGVGPKLLAEWVNAVMDWDLDMRGLLHLGERLFNLKRLFNVRLGIGRKDDTLPERLLTQDRGTGRATGNPPPLDKMLTEYYELRGWDEGGIPKPEKLEELGLPVPASQS
ncbi:MAG: aldehyde ferredoxin oxidoreductase C-terminal domain-containing protein, partial [candidate division NC10 bacterium]|nr:aldehyde ferredoxin oxidoreductase C-terminal domain-containing protein [candidate division NC10 bacterium]